MYNFPPPPSSRNSSSGSSVCSSSRSGKGSIARLSEFAGRRSSALFMSAAAASARSRPRSVMAMQQTRPPSTGCGSALGSAGGELLLLGSFERRFRRFGRRLFELLNGVDLFVTLTDTVNTASECND